MIGSCIIRIHHQFEVAWEGYSSLRNNIINDLKEIVLWLNKIIVLKKRYNK